MYRRSFIKNVVLAQVVGSMPLGSLNQDKMMGKDSRDATGTGTLTKRYELTLHRVLSGGRPAYTEDFILRDVRPEPGRRFTEYSGDVSGRYVGALATTAAFSKTDFPALGQLVTKILELQKPEGYFGKSFHHENLNDDDMALLWGNGRLLVGLLEYYRNKPRPEVLVSSKQIGDFLVKIGPLMNSNAMRQQFSADHYGTSYICWTQTTEGLAELYRLTNEPSYKELAEKIATFTEHRAGEHVHGFLTSLRGIVSLYQVTGEQRFLDQVERNWQAIADSNDLLVTGGVPERFSPQNHRTEGCAEVDWIRLSLALWKLTEKPKYLAMAERTIFNEFAMNQFDNGDYGGRVIASTGITGDNAARGWECCSLHGLRCFPDIASSVFRIKEDAVYYDLPVDGHNTTSGLAFAAVSSLERNRNITLTALSASGQESQVMIRRPGWAAALEITVNGKQSSTVDHDGYRELTRKWRSGDMIAIRYAMKTSAVPWRDSERIALFHGPWLLGIDSSTDPYYFDEPNELNRIAVSAGGHDDLRLEPASTLHTGTFAVPVAQFRLRYLPGGYPIQPQEATLHPVAEQTGMATTEWEFLFNPATGAR